MFEKVISGGQTGADQAGWRAARTCNIPTGGWMPHDFLTEAGPRPDFAAEYGAFEMPTVEYSPRTRKNAAEADATIWFGDTGSSGSATTHRACRDLGRPVLDVTAATIPSDAAEWIEAGGYKTLNVAGNRESGNPGIGAETERFLIDVFRELTGR